MNMQDKETARVETFSDGVFAIAMTLLVLEFKVPHLPQEVTGSKWALLVELMNLWPSFVAFGLSFGTILVMWVNHHGLFRYAHRADNRLLFVNGFLLLIVTFVPFPTAVLAEYLDQRSANVAAVFYCGTYVLVSVGYNLLQWAVAHSRIDTSHAHEVAISRIRRAYRVGLVVYLLATGVSVFSAFGGLAICLSLWGLWALLDYSPDDIRSKLKNETCR